MPQHRKTVSWSLALASALAFVVGASVTAENPEPQQPQQQQQQQQDPPDPGRGGGGRAGQAQGPRPYNTVITSAAKTDEGIFKVHRIGDTVFYEIPKAELGKDFVWDTQIKRTTIGAGYGGQSVSNRVVRWVAKGDRVLLLNIDYSTVADPSLPVAIAVDDANYPGIIRAFPVDAYAPSGDPVINVTPIFMTDIAEFSVRAAVGGRGMDNTRSFFERAVSFPENINVEVTMTFTGGAAEGGGGGGGGRGGGRAPGMRGPSGTVVVHHSMVKLPDRPMMPRLYDERVGYITQSITDYGTDEHRSVARRLITRYRLEKKDPNAAVSEPVRPIVYYIDAATPKVFIPFVRKGIEDWLPAFEAAGFRNAIVARETPANDPEWSSGDARYSMVRWVPSTEETRSFVHDPRSGEILASDISIYNNVQNFGPNWYFIQVAPLDKRAQQLPLPEALQGELIRYFVAHQVGHTLGLQHNNKAGSAYTIEQIRDPKWVKTMSHTPTVMDDSRFNYVAQPEDGIDPVDLIPRVGPYDKFAIRWGYAPVAGAKSPDTEKPTLDQWARVQDKEAYLRYSTEGQNNTDPGDIPDAVGDADPVRATTLGLRNLAKVSDLLLKATSTKVGDPWEDLEQSYGRMVNQWSIELGHVTRVIGGLETRQTHIGQGDGIRFKTVPRARQVEALNFLLANAFTPPNFLIKPDILRRVEPVGVVDRIRTAQSAVMSSLLQSARLDRMTEQFTLDGATAYPPLQFLMDLRAGVWSELAKPGTAIGLYRRNVQRSYLDNMDQRLNGSPGASAEVRSLVKGELRALMGQLKSAASAPGLDENTRRHVTDSVDEITMILDPRVPRPAPEPGAAPAGRGRGGVR